MQSREVARGLFIGAAIIVFRGRAILSPYSDIATGLYTSVALALRAGHLPYTTVWEYKPPGFFVLYALATMAMSPAVVAWTLGTVSLLATAFAVYTIGRAVDRECGSHIAWIAAAFFALLSSENEAVTSDAELEVSAFVSGALAIALTRRPTLAHILSAGALAGFALQCKLNAALLVPLPFFAFGSAAFSVPALALYGGAVSMPIIVEAFVYAHAGLLHLLIDSNVSASIRRMHSEHGAIFSRNIGWLAGQLRILAPVVELAAFAPLSIGGRAQRIVFGWPLATLASILAAGELYPRHFVLLAAPVAVLGACGFCRLLAIARKRSTRLATVFAVAIFATTYALHAYFETVSTIRSATADLLGYGDTIGLRGRLVAAIAAVGGPHPSLFVVAVDPYVYDLAEACALTKYRDAEHLFDSRLSSMAGIDSSQELKSIMAGNPQVVIIPRTFSGYHWSKPRLDELLAFVRERYVLAQNVREYGIYKVRSSAARRTDVDPARRSRPLCDDQ